MAVIMADIWVSIPQHRISNTEEEAL